MHILFSYMYSYTFLNYDTFFYNTTSKWKILEEFTVKTTGSVFFVEKFLIADSSTLWNYSAFKFIFVLVLVSCIFMVCLIQF